MLLPPHCWSGCWPSRAGSTSGGSGSTKITEKAADDIFYDAGDYIVPFGCAAEW